MLEILYRDEYLVAINKPSGLLVHRSPIDRRETEFAVQILRDQIGQFVYPVHRLDKPTSGVLLFALDKESAKLIGEQFRSRESKKSYLAVVRGYIDESGVIEHALSVKLDKIADKDSSNDKEAQEATTHYRRVATVEIPYAVGKYDKTRYSLVSLEPQTGRKHQLRRHMKHISHHILGDTKYGRGEHNKLIREEFNCHRMLLHASSLQIKHPYTNDTLIIKAPLDETFKAIYKFFNWYI
ncbi:MAG: tRNA pseudouridine(65) synthase TruC [Sulfurimonas sp.]|uniref:tRNA pseudouridine(65) synthase TruC n=1 Tax=Sulfurimonas sp. TaxID=2022749 RepID=UPI003D102167